MRISLIITTATADPITRKQMGSDGVRVHAQREALLRNAILPRTEQFDEVFLAGRPADYSDDFPHVTHIHVPPWRRDRREALHIREVASRHATGDVLVYMADDHHVGDCTDFTAEIHRVADDDWDILTPKRLVEETEEELNRGKDHLDGFNYSGLHCQVLRREVWATCPWFSVKCDYMDVGLSRIWKENGFKMTWPDEPVCYDVE